MPSDLVRYSFAGGEISPQLFGQVDLDIYAKALAEATNFYVEYRGGLSNRGGSEWCDFIDGNLGYKLHKFQFGPNTSSTYLLVFTDKKVRFMQSGGYVLEASKPITGITNDGIPKFTIVGHGFSVGDWFRVFSVVGPTQVNYQTFQVLVVDDANHVEVLWANGLPFDTTTMAAYVSGGTAARVYTVVTPYAGADLATLRAHQSRSVITLTHSSYPVQELTRIADANWTCAAMTVGNGVATPTGLAITPDTAGTAAVAFCVTAVDINGNESLPSAYVFNLLITDYTTVGTHFVNLTWTKVAKAVYYKIYRTQIFSVAADISRGAPVGLIGVSYGTKATDRNLISPDYTQTPPVQNNPFANGAITFIEVTAPGAGYTRASTVTASGGGTGLVAYPVVDSGGGILGIVVVNGGSGYVSPVITVSAGAGATFLVFQSAASGNAPRVSTIFQQRRAFAGSVANPLTANLSRPAQQSNFDVSFFSQSDDALEFEIDSEEVAPIRWIFPSRAGLWVMNQAGVWQLAGSDGVAVTPTSALADPQAYTGVAEVAPLLIDVDLLYVEGKGVGVRLLQYDNNFRVFNGMDISAFASHLFPLNYPVVATSWAADPSRLAYFVRADGFISVLALDKQQKVFGWTKYETQGFYKDVLTLQENNVDTTYTVVERPIFPPATGSFAGGFITTLVIEKFHRRDFVNVEDAWFVDYGVALRTTSRDAILSLLYPSGTGQSVTAFNAAVPLTAIFFVGDVGKIIRVGGGKAIITAFVNQNTVTVDWLRPITQGFYPQGTQVAQRNYASSTWTIDTPVDTIDNAVHLCNQTVDVLGDGNVFKDLLVSELGVITLPQKVTRAIVGLSYQARAKTLPPVSQDGQIDGRMKRATKVVARVYNTRGLATGDDLAYLDEFNDRSIETLSQETGLQSGMREAYIDAKFDIESALYFVQNYPLPLTITGFVAPTEVGDET